MSGGLRDLEEESDLEYDEDSEEEQETKTKQTRYIYFSFYLYCCLFNQGVVPYLLRHWVLSIYVPVYRLLSLSSSSTNHAELFRENYIVLFLLTSGPLSCYT